MDEKTAIERGDRIVEVFREMVREGASRVGVEASEDSEHYLVSLLVERSRAEAGDRAVAEILLDETDGRAPQERLRAAGDEALFIAGVLPDSLDRSIVSVGYYHRVGRMAYGNLSARLGKRALAKLFAELAGKFGTFADVLWEVARRARLARDPSLLVLYDRAVRTGSGHLRKLLRARGVSPVAGVILSPQ